MQEMTTEPNNDIPETIHSRRAILKGVGLAGIAGLGAILSIPATAAKSGGDENASSFLETMVNVKDFGAIGDSHTDDTGAFQKAMDSLAISKSGTVFAPAGHYVIKGHLVIPEGICLRGCFENVPYAIGGPTGGTCLLAYEGKGDPSATPFLTMHTNATLKGLQIFYPEQTQTNPPLEYPWTVASAGGRNLSIIDVLMINPYMAVDFGSRNTTPHYICNLYAYPLFRGIYVDRCYDCGKMENVILWPFWQPDLKHPLNTFVLENFESFIFGRVDWQVCINCFVIWTKVGFRFTDHNPDGVARFAASPEARGGAQGANVMLYGGGADTA